MEGVKSEVTCNGISATELADTVRQAAMGVGFHPTNIREVMPDESDMREMIKEGQRELHRAYKSLESMAGSNRERSDRYETELENRVTSLGARPSVTAYGRLQRRCEKHRKHIHMLEAKLDEKQAEVDTLNNSLKGWGHAANRIQNSVHRFLRAMCHGVRMDHPMSRDAVDNMLNHIVHIVKAPNEAAKAEIEAEVGRRMERYNENIARQASIIQAAQNKLATLRSLSTELKSAIDDVVMSKNVVASAKAQDRLAEAHHAAWKIEHALK